MPIIRASARKYKKSSQFLGIKNRGGKYFTGQEQSSERPNGLTQQEIKNPDIIPIEKRKNFPQVITPDTYISIFDGQTLQEEGVSKDDDVIWGLLKLQPNVALNKRDLNPANHDWYIENPEVEAKSKAKERRKKNRALKYVDEAAISKQQTFLVFVSSEHGKVNVNPRILSPDRIYTEAVDAAEEYPESAVAFFEGKDPLIKKKVGILELMSYEIIKERNNAYYDGSTFLGTNLTEVGNFLDAPENAPTRDKLFKLLSKAKNGGKDYKRSQKELDSIQAGEIIDRAKIAYADDEYQKAKDLLNKINGYELDDATQQKFDNLNKKVLEAMTSNDDIPNYDKLGSLDINHNSTTISPAYNTGTDSDANFDDIEEKTTNESWEDMSLEEIRSFLRSKKISGWKKTMSKMELIEHYENNK